MNECFRFFCISKKVFIFILLTQLRCIVTAVCLFLFVNCQTAVTSVCLLLRISICPDTVIASSAHAVKEVTLPDNSHITLAENSALQYDRLAYGKKNRNVTLNGKAYFSVTHQEQCPFRVQTELANIQVLGTQFQVTANANQTSATVESGKVRFYNKEQKEAILTKGMYAFINQKGQMQINKQSDPNTFAWKTHVFVYNEAPLKKVVKELEEVYKVHIGGIPQKEYYLTTTFDNTPIEDIIEIINQTLDTKLDITQ